MVLIEIEKPRTKLLKKDGDMHSELNHAIEQVRNWLHEVTQERSEIIKEIGKKHDLKPDDVTKVRGVVIAGRDNEFDDNEIRRLKAKNLGDVELFTYDDILRGLGDMLQGLITI